MPEMSIFHIIGLCMGTVCIFIGLIGMIIKVIRGD